jgi:RHS repeat-associated protein
LYIADIAINSTDGTVTHLFNGESQTLPLWTFADYDTNVTAAVETVPVSQDPTGPGPGNYTTHFFIGDHLGSAQMEFAWGGWPVWQGQFAPYGQELQNGALLPTDAPDGSTNHYKFTGKERDAESGLDYFGARYYASSMGRWMSPDWSAKEEPVPYAKLDNPQSLNLYGYVLNNPLAHADADGHQEERDASAEPEAAAARIARSGLRPMTLEEAEAAVRFQRPLTPEQRAFNERYIFGSGGRWGGNRTRRQNSTIADTFVDAGYKVLGGAYDKEEFIKGSGPGNKGGTFVNLTVTDGKQVIRVQTVDLTAEGKLTPAEESAAARIRAKYPNDKLFLVAKTPYRRPASSDPVVPPMKVK